MITDQDVDKLKTIFTTKEDFAGLKLEVGALHDKVDSIESKIDGLAGLIHASLEEHGAGAVHLARHDRHIAFLAQHAEVILPE